jgi:hypothetical protein
MAKVGIFNEISKFLSKKTTKKDFSEFFLLILHHVSI